MCKLMCGSKSQDIGLLVLRVFVGGLFIVHGVLKAMNMSDAVTFFNQIGFSSFWAYVVTVVEIVGGLAVVLGLFSFYGAALLAIVMVVAIFKAWTLSKNLFLVEFLGSKAELSLLVSLVAIMLTGPGKISLKKGCGNCCKDNKVCAVAKAEDTPTV